MLNSNLLLVPLSSYQRRRPQAHAQVVCTRKKKAAHVRRGRLVATGVNYKTARIIYFLCFDIKANLARCFVLASMISLNRCP